MVQECHVRHEAPQRRRMGRCHNRLIRVHDRRIRAVAARQRGDVRGLKIKGVPHGLSLLFFSIP